MNKMTHTKTATRTRALVFVLLFFAFWITLFTLACNDNGGKESFNRQAFHDSCKLSSVKIDKLCLYYLNAPLEPIDKSFVYLQLGDYLEDEGLLDSALTYYQKAFNIRTAEDPNSENTLNAEAAIASIYRTSGSYAIAKKKYLSLITRSKNPKWISAYSNDLAITYYKMYALDSASYYFGEALKYAHQTKDEVLVGNRLYNYLININNVQSDSLEKYIPILAKNRKYLQTKNGPFQLNFLKFLLAKNKKDYVKCEQLLFERKVLTDSLGSKKDKISVNATFAHFYYNQTKEFKKSAGYYKNYVSLLDDWYGTELNLNLSKTRVKYETKLLIESNENLENRLRFQYLFIIFLAVVLLLGFFAYKNHKRKQKAEIAEALALKDLEIKELFEDVDQNNLDAWVEGQATERKRLAQDLHDRLGGLLTLVNLNFENFQSRIKLLEDDGKKSADTMQSLIKQAISEVRTISHDINDSRISSVGLVKALEELSTKVNQANGLQVHLFTKIVSDKIDPKLEIALYRITQEALNNVIKHSKAKNLHINLLEEKNSLRLTLEDDGSGFAKKDITEGLGTQNMKIEPKPLEVILPLKVLRMLAQL